MDLKCSLYIRIFLTCTRHELNMLSKVFRDGEGVAKIRPQTIDLTKLYMNQAITNDNHITEKRLVQL